MRMKGPHGTKRIQGPCLCHGEVHRFKVAFQTKHRQKFEVIGE